MKNKQTKNNNKKQQTNTIYAFLFRFVGGTSGTTKMDILNKAMLPPSVSIL